MSATDRITRLVIALLLAGLNIIGIVSLPESILVWIAAIVMGVTAFVGYCSMYTLFGINTKDKRKYGNNENP